jgi:hypothetical protein
MRWLAGLLVLVVVGACAGDGVASCGSSQPPAACVQRGLATVDLRGIYSCTGTQTTQNTDPPGNPMTGDIFLMKLFEVDGCTFMTGTLTGTIDDTQASASGPMETANVCATASGELRFTGIVTYDNRATGGTMGTRTTYCSLRRQ